MTSMDSAARAIDALLHRGRAEVRDGGVWLDDLAATAVVDEVTNEDGESWKSAAIEWEREYDRVDALNDALIVDRDEATDALHDIMRLVGIPLRANLPVGTVPDMPDSDIIIERIRERVTEWRDEVSTR